MLTAGKKRGKKDAARNEAAEKTANERAKLALERENLETQHRMRPIARAGAAIGTLVALSAALVGWLTYRTTSLKNALDAFDKGNPALLVQIGSRGTRVLATYVDPAGLRYPDKLQRTTDSLRYLHRHTTDLHKEDLSLLQDRAAEGEHAMKMALLRIDTTLDRDRLPDDAEIDVLTQITCAEMLLYTLRNIRPTGAWPGLRSHAQTVLRKLPDC